MTDILLLYILKQWIVFFARSDWLLMPSQWVSIVSIYLLKLIFISVNFSILLGIVMYANEIETKEK